MLKFPAFDGTASAEVNLNDESQLWLKEHGANYEVANPLLRPDVCQLMVNDLHQRLFVESSFGGYLEDRAQLWAGSYLERANRPWHLGVDVNMPAGTQAIANQPLTVRFVDGPDPAIQDDDNGAWGSRIIVESVNEEDPLLLLAHLSNEKRWHIGQVIQPEEVIATIGSWENSENGNWYDHVHIQGVTRQRFEELLRTDPTLQNLNGYAHTDDLENVKIWYPNPSPYVVMPGHLKK
jgi:hypothetical protein